LKPETGNLKYVLLALLLSARTALGFEAVMKLQPPLIGLNDSAVLSIEVRDAKNPQPPALPDVPGLRIAYAGQSQQHTWVNGKSDSYIAYNYQIYPQKTGTFMIGPFDYKLNGETKTLSEKLQVVGASGEAQQPQSWSDLLFARLAADRNSAYVQEPFALTLSIYSRQGLQMAGNISLNGMPQTGLPDLQWQEGPPEREVVNGSVFDVRRFTARTRAMSSGTFVFEPSITVPVVIPNPNRQSRSPFDDPFFSSMFQRTETRPVDVPVDAATVEVKPLPDTGRPAGFNGAVGRFTFRTSAKPTAVQIGDPITLQLVISGDGNFDRVMMPPLPVEGPFRLFGDPVRKPTDNAVVFEQVISPRSAAAKEIPAVAFSFFDTESGAYRTVQSEPIPLTVTATSNSTAQVFAAKESMVPPPEEHAFATESDVQRAAAWFSNGWKKIRPQLWIVPAVLLLTALLAAGRKLYRCRSNDTARARRQKAPKAARHALRQAEQASKRNDAKAFYDALWCALSDYFGHKLNLPPGGVTPSAALQALERKEFDPDQRAALSAIFEQVEARRYGFASSSSPEEMQKLLSGLEQILKRCEKTAL
jgi:hypothetical protein